MFKAYKIIAVDFDGTLCFSKWPELGEPNTALISSLIKWHSKGNKLILWTCRAGKELENAVSWCSDQGLHFDAINDNLPETIEQFGSNSRKISCDLYIDDRALDPGTIPPTGDQHPFLPFFPKFEESPSDPDDCKLMRSS